MTNQFSVLGAQIGIAVDGPPGGQIRECRCCLKGDTVGDAVRSTRLRAIDREALHQQFTMILNN
jgi:hypothetical protein